MMMMMMMMISICIDLSLEQQWPPPSDTLKRISIGNVRDAPLDIQGRARKNHLLQEIFFVEHQKQTFYFTEKYVQTFFFFGERKQTIFFLQVFFQYLQLSFAIFSFLGTLTSFLFLLLPCVSCYNA